MMIALNILLAVICFLIFFTLNSFYQLRHIFRFARQHKGYRFIPFIGNLLHFINNDNIFTCVQKVIKRYGLPCNIWLLHNYNYITADANEAKVVLTHPNALDKMDFYICFSFFVKDTSLLTPGHIWKKRRRIFSRSFSPLILRNLVHRFYMNSETLLDILNQSKNTSYVFANLAMDNFLGSVFEKDCNLQLGPTKDTVVAVIHKAQATPAYLAVLSAYLDLVLLGFISNIHKKIKQLHMAIEPLTNLVENLWHKKQEKVETQLGLLENSDTNFPLLDIMSKYKKQNKNFNILKEIRLFTAAASDTTGVALGNTFTLLGMHPDIQAKLYNEVISVVGHDHIITAEDLPNLKYTEQCINEAMRLFPPIPQVGRKAGIDIDLGTKVVPKGADILIAVFNLHRNEKYWPDPLKYDPDRFLPEEIAKRPPYAFIPFSGGQRDCIGKTFAMMSMKVIVANVIRNFEIYSKHKSVTEFQLGSFMTLITTQPLHREFKARMKSKFT